MRVLVISGDRSFRAGHPRFDVQAKVVEEFEVVYWGMGALFPSIPKGTFDVVTTQDPFFRGLVGWLVARSIGARFNVQVHADLEKQNAFKYFLATVVLSHADSVRVVSGRVKTQVEKMKIGAPITVLPVYIDLEPFRGLERVLYAQPTILWLGRFEGEKDPLRAVEVLKEVRKKLPEARLIMLGAGSLEGRLRAATKGLPVDFPGWKSPLEYMSKAHVVLSTSHAESWGASIVEALAAGVPVVAPDVGIAREAGAIVVTRSELADKVIEVLDTQPKGILNINPFNKKEWLNKWKETLI